ncbi:MAG TPA: glycosyltransferase family 9 protein [Ktedonobacteraceae bacterium]|jgi:ADP-heptose:LPS heptosyltransferase
MRGPKEITLHQQMIDRIESDVPVCSLVNKGSIKVAAAVLKQGDVCIGNDAGLMHLAVAVKTSPIAIFGLSNQKM